MSGATVKQEKIRFLELIIMKIWVNKSKMLNENVSKVKSLKFKQTS